MGCCGRHSGTSGRSTGNQKICHRDDRGSDKISDQYSFSRRSRLGKLFFPGSDDYRTYAVCQVPKRNRNSGFGRNKKTEPVFSEFTYRSPSFDLLARWINPENRKEKSDYYVNSRTHRGRHFGLRRRRSCPFRGRRLPADPATERRRLSSVHWCYP